MALVEDAAGNVYDDGTSGGSTSAGNVIYADPYQKGMGSGAGTNVVTDPSGIITATPGGIFDTSILGAFKGIFERLKSGQTTANDVHAALGVLGLLMPSLTQPRTAGWKGSIDLNKPFTRTPIVNPATSYVPYSGQPVMGRQYFNTSYTAPAAPVAPPVAMPVSQETESGAVAAPAPSTEYVNPDLQSAGAMARGGIANLRRFAGGGPASPETGEAQQRSAPQFYDYHVGANARMVNVPGIEKPVLMFFDTPNNRVVVSDEGYWNPNSPVGKDLDKAVAWARDQGLQAGVVVSPYSWDGFGKDAIGEKVGDQGPHPRQMAPASFDQLKEYMNAADFVVTDPYVVSAQTATPAMQEKLTEITGMIGDHANETGKPAWLVLGGSTAPEGTDPNLIYNYTDNLLGNVGNKFNQVSVYEGTRDGGGTTWDYLNAANILAKNGIQPTGNYGQAYETQTSVPATPALGYDIGNLKVSSLQDFLKGPNLQDPSNWGKATGYLDPATELAKTLAEQAQQPKAQPTGIGALGGAGQPSAGYQFATREGGIGENQYLQNIRDYVQQNIGQPQAIKNAADQYGVSFGDIQNAFKSTPNMQYAGYEDVIGQVGNLFNQPSTNVKVGDISGNVVDQRRFAAQEPPNVTFAQSAPVSQQEDQQQPIDYARSPGAAQGGLMGLARGGQTNPPRYLRGATDGMADKLPSSIDGRQPAKLSHGEFVIPADVVSHLGNGNSDAGANVLYKMMDRVRKARTGTTAQGKKINPEKFTPGGIAGYAGGGTVAFAAGDLVPSSTGSGAPSLGTSTETNISSWAGPYVGDMLSKTAALTNAPYQAYTGPLTAGYSPLQEKTFTGLQGLQFPGVLGQSFTGAGAPTIPQASTTGPMQTVGAPGGIAANYMNPYLNAVLQPQLEELRRQSQISEMGNAAKFAQAGGYGGGREAIMRSEGQRNLLSEMNKAIGTGYASAYDKALQQFNTEQQQAKTLAEMMAGAGTQQRDIEQQGITEARKQFETEQKFPYENLRFQREMLTNMPVQTAATTANTSTLGDIKGGLADLQTTLKALGVG